MSWGDPAECRLCASCTAWTSRWGRIARSACVGATGLLLSGTAGALGFTLTSHGFTPGGTGGTGNSAGSPGSTGVGGSDRLGAGPGGGVRTVGCGERPRLESWRDGGGWPRARVAGRGLGLETELSDEGGAGRSGRASSFMRMMMSYTRGAAFRDSFCSLANCSGSNSSSSM